MKPRPTVAQHKALGAELKATRLRLQTIAIELSKHYPNDSRVVRRAFGAQDAVDQLRCVLDDVVCQENPTASDADTIGCYYGHQAGKHT
jgi:hypothetical protein